MRLHIFNPEHDICLARNTARTIVPKAARRVRESYGHVPAYWAADGDAVVVDDVTAAAMRLAAEGRPHAAVKFITLDDVAALSVERLPSEIVPWGWNKSIAATLLKTNPLLADLLPDEARLDEIRRMSSRVFAATVFLPRLLNVDARLVGRMDVFRGQVKELDSIVRQKGAAVLKSPWSSSGRGVRFVRKSLSDNDLGWANRILNEQGSIVIEPMYDKLTDFAMEFFVNEDFTVHYLGLSVFATERGAYRGNVIDTESGKRRIVEQHLPPELLDKVKNAVLAAARELFADRYTGPFGVDMMAVRTPDGAALDPCVEINLRYTMGHAALLSPAAFDAFAGK